MENKTCCITGHRDIPHDKIEYVKSMIKKEIESAISYGYDTFISGFAQGVDLYFAQIVLEAKEKSPHIQLHAALPFKERLKSTYPLFQKCISACSHVYIAREIYSNASYFERNRYMVNNSSLVIAVYDGRLTGGSFYTVNYAREKKKTLHFINV